MEGISRGRHRRQAPASMQKDAATLGRFKVGGYILVFLEMLPQNILSFEREQEQMEETRLHSRGSPTRWTRQWWSLSSRTPGFQSNRNPLPLHLLCRLGDGTEGVPDGALLHREEREESEDPPPLPVYPNLSCIRWYNFCHLFKCPNLLKHSAIQRCLPLVMKQRCCSEEHVFFITNTCHFISACYRTFVV